MYRQHSFVYDESVLSYVDALAVERRREIDCLFKAFVLCRASSMSLILHQHHLNVIKIPGQLDDGPHLHGAIDLVANEINTTPCRYLHSK